MSARAGTGFLGLQEAKKALFGSLTGFLACPMGYRKEKKGSP
jgi:hypothetical protein